MRNKQEKQTKINVLLENLKYIYNIYFKNIVNITKICAKPVHINNNIKCNNNIITIRIIKLKTLI